MKLKVRVIPNAKKSGFSGRREDEWVLRLSAHPVDGKANKAALEFIAKSLACCGPTYRWWREKRVDTKFLRL